MIVSYQAAVDKVGASGHVCPVIRCDGWAGGVALELVVLLDEEPVGMGAG